MSERLNFDFFNRDTILVARKLLGCQVRRKIVQEDGEIWKAWTIVETEAYTADDPACHAYQKNKGRAAMLYSAPGTAYVYFTYGMHHCFNVVTEPLGIAGAVLIRALEPTTESNAVTVAVKETLPAFRTNGPGRLARALNLTKANANGLCLTDIDNPGGIFLTAGEAIPDEQVIQTTRIGLSKAVEYPWRYYIRGNPWVSVRDRAAER